MSTTTKEKAHRIWRIIKRTLIFLILFQFFYILLLKWVDPPFTLTQLGSLFTGNGLKRDYVDMKQVSSYGRLSFIAAEDQLFPDHNGFDWKSIQKAMEYNKKKPNRIKGASTISQQVAKNVFLWQGRSWLRKGLEVYFTFMIELMWGKNRIMEMYLNVSEMGPGVFGIEAAAQNYFKKPAKKLTRQEAAMIASCMPNPKKYTVKPLSRYVARRYPWVMTQMSFLQNDPDIQKLLQY
ncbi:monofunctional biosynthetic peptidoglycan transglycosylase [Niastella sp. OAS944]|uniref:monofunctional biosynthetic peptidoglycan transglycosylase n=1 Tax=Niastella sp. OAS944 TaxID=2664089 RepID=UPI003483352C|nr:monofunctional biosynthetic peptidoglycan transglycosylase [Chitinophagaceae bacterium OAS944]